MNKILHLAGAAAMATLAQPALADHLTPINEVSNASCETQSNLEGGRSYQVLLPAKDDEGRQISFQVLEPNSFDCDTLGAHPLVLQGPGFSGTRSISGFEDFRNAGYTVISWDPRGFGDTTGTVRVMDPEFEGQYYVQILDWAEKNLDYLAWHNNSANSRRPVPRPPSGESSASGRNLLVGAIGGSYGGGYQLMLLTVDGKQRLDAIMPDIIWHDLRNSLNPGDAVKTLWDLALSALGTASGYGSPQSVPQRAEDINGMDPFIEETLARGASLNEWPRQSLDWFHYRGLGYWCAANGLPAMTYPQYGADNVPMFDTAGSYNVPARENGRPGFGDFLQPVESDEPATHFRQLDVLLTQGMIDTLFNFNEAWWNYQCLTAAGANVALHTHNTGHAVPGGQSPDKVYLNSNACPVHAQEQRLAWMNSKLKGGEELDLAETCFALGGSEDVIYMNAEDVIAPGASQDYTTRTLQGPNPAPEGVVVPNGVVGVANVTGNANVPAVLGTIGGDGAILAGLPRITVTVSSGHGANEAVRDGAEAGDCALQSVPLRTGCDSIIFVGIGRRSGGAPNFALIDDQVTPLRGLGEHDVDLVGIAERLQPGDELAVVFFAEHPQFFGSVSRDVTLPGVLVAGEVKLPLFAVDAEGNPVPGQDADALLEAPASPL